MGMLWGDFEPIGTGSSTGVLFPSLFVELRVSLSSKDTAAVLPSNSGTFTKSSRLVSVFQLGGYWFKSQPLV